SRPGRGSARTRAFVVVLLVSARTCAAGGAVSALRTQAGAALLLALGACHSAAPLAVAPHTVASQNLRVSDKPLDPRRIQGAGRQSSRTLRRQAERSRRSGATQGLARARRADLARA